MPDAQASSTQQGGPSVLLCAGKKHAWTSARLINSSPWVLVQVLDQVADDKSLIIAVGYMLRSSPAVVAAKQLMDQVSLSEAPETVQNT